MSEFNHELIITQQVLLQTSLQSHPLISLGLGIWYHSSYNFIMKLLMYLSLRGFKLFKSRNHDHLFCLRILICEKTLGNIVTSHIGLVNPKQWLFTQNHILFFGIHYVILNPVSCSLTCLPQRKARWVLFN